MDEEVYQNSMVPRENARYSVTEKKGEQFEGGFSQRGLFVLLPTKTCSGCANAVRLERAAL